MNKILSIYGGLFVCFETQSIVTWADPECRIFLPPLQALRIQVCTTMSSSGLYFNGIHMDKCKQCEQQHSEVCWSQIQYVPHRLKCGRKAQHPTGVLFWVVVKLGGFKGVHLKGIFPLIRLLSLLPPPSPPWAQHFCFTSGSTQPNQQTWTENSLFSQNQPFLLWSCFLYVSVTMTIANTKFPQI